jgi:hypothetical protein
MIEHRVVGSIDEECYADFWEALCDEDGCDWRTNTFTEERARAHLAAHRAMMHED